MPLLINKGSNTFRIAVESGEQPKSTNVIILGDISSILLENLHNKQKWHSSIQISKCI